MAYSRSCADERSHYTGMGRKDAVMRVLASTTALTPGKFQHAVELVRFISKLSELGGHLNVRRAIGCLAMPETDG